MSSQMSSNHLTAETSLKDPAFSDPYLSAPLDADEADFRSSAIRLTPVPDDVPSQLDLGPSPCPSIHPDNSSVSVFSPEEFLSSSSRYDSPDGDGGVQNPGLNISMAEFDNWQTSSVFSHEPHGKPAVQLTSPQPMFPSAQVFSPLLSDDAGPPSDMVDPSLFSSGSEALLSPDNMQKQNGLMPHLMNSSISDGLSMKVEPESRARSPIVMVESVSRGDSPVNAFRRPSAAFLAPGGDSSEEDADIDDGQSSISRAEDGSWVRDMTTGQAGVDPTARDDVWVPSPNEMESNRVTVDKHADIHNWTASVSAARNDTADDQFLNLRGLERPKNRRRAKSTGDPSLQQDLFALKSQYGSLAIPGPGLLLQVKTDEGFSELGSGLGSDSPTSMFHTGDEMDNNEFPSFNEVNPQLEEPLPSQFVRSKAPYHNPTGGAMTKDLDRASIIANWGTRDMGEAEFNRITRGDTLENLTIDETDKSQERERRGSSFMSLLPRAASPLKRPRSAVNPSSGEANDNNQDQAGLQRHASTSSNRRKFSLGRSPRSRNLSTGNAMAAMAGTMAAVGSGDRLAAPGTLPSSTRPTWHRGRSKSEVPLPASMMAGFGGPPAPVSNNFGFQNPPPQVVEPATLRNGPSLDDDDEDEEGMVMEFPVQSRLPVPTLEGFKQQIMELNPRLEASLLDRFANEQVRRYKDLVDHKMAHASRVNTKTCASHHFCFQQGGDAAQAKAPELSATQTQFHIPSHKSDCEYSQTLSEGAVSAAQFPPGVPMPPVQRLPAEFECSICFKVRKFQKPSDWTKHVHEDVQPFTCTFPECTEPKSFKRKADWVRHESERHRQLEWWTCSFLDCQHTCYRKDNFVQHLVREHKMPEPKAKKTSKSKGRPTPEEIQREHEVAQLWKVVDSCRHETTKNPREEPCRFCGNVCNGWKKLTVHLAKHMEQIALPVLGLVQERSTTTNNSSSIGPIHANSSPAAVSSTKNMPPMPMGDASAVAFTYPPPSLTNTSAAAAPMQDNQFFSAEPESMNPYEEMASSQQFLHPQVEQDQLLLQQTSPLHHSSVTYPPASFDAVSRSRTPDLHHHDVHSTNGHHMNMDGLYSGSEFMDPIYDQQGSMYLSPTQEYSDPMAMATATSLSYDSGAAHLQGQYM